MLRWERVVRVEGPDESYVVWAVPKGRTPVMTPPQGALIYYVWEQLRQLVRREPWIVAVQEDRAAPDDPVLWEDSCESRGQALRLLRSLRDDLRERGLRGIKESRG